MGSNERIKFVCDGVTVIDAVETVLILQIFDKNTYLPLVPGNAGPPQRIPGFLPIAVLFIDRPRLFRSNSSQGPVAASVVSHSFVVFSRLEGRIFHIELFSGSL